MNSNELTERRSVLIWIITNDDATKRRSCDPPRHYRTNISTSNAQKCILYKGNSFAVRLWKGNQRFPLISWDMCHTRVITAVPWMHCCPMCVCVCVCVCACLLFFLSPGSSVIFSPAAMECLRTPVKTLEVCYSPAPCPVGRWFVICSRTRSGGTWRVDLKSQISLPIKNISPHRPVILWNVVLGHQIWKRQNKTIR